MMKITKIELTRGYQHNWVPTVFFTADLGATTTQMVLTLAPIEETHPLRPDVERILKHCVDEVREVITNATQVIE
jgi:hypothetical protein